MSTTPQHNKKTCRLCKEFLREKVQRYIVYDRVLRRVGHYAFYTPDLRTERFELLEVTKGTR